MPSTNWRTTYCASAPRQAPTLSGFALLVSLSRPLSDADKTHLADEFCSDAHYRIWYAAFRQLAAQPAALAAYDHYYAQQNRNVARRLARLYQERNLVPTEVDWAFFLDRGTQFTTNLAAARAALDALPANATPAQRRLAISRAHRPDLASHRRLRVGRDIAYVIDVIAPSDLTQEERDAWAYYGRRRAAQVGLSDARAVLDTPF